jgi:hypothetical protein
LFLLKNRFTHEERTPARLSIADTNLSIIALIDAYLRALGIVKFSFEAADECMENGNIGYS